MAFYIYHDGKRDFIRVTLQEWIKFWEPLYFLGTTNNIPEKEDIPRLKGSSFVESIIEKILLYGFQIKDDIIKAVAWKIGAIKHEVSEQSSREQSPEFTYRNDFENTLQLNSQFGTIEC